MDTEPERHALIEKVYPSLYRFCKEKGYEFRMFDLRWGVKDGVSNSNNLMALHLETLKQCQESEGLNFVLFSGQKHDAPVVPEAISRKEFEAIHNKLYDLKLAVSKQKQFRFNSESIKAKEAALETKSAPSDNGPSGANPNVSASISDSKENANECSNEELSDQNVLEDRTVLLDRFQSNAPKSAVEYEKDTGLLCQWYKLDENSIPGVYRLQPVSTHHRDMYSKDPLRRQQAKNKWLDSSKKLYTILQEYAPMALGAEAASQLLRTVLQREVDQGLTQDPPEEHCYWFKRNITDIKYNLSSEKAFEYIDILPRQPEINQERYAAHQIFINNTLAKLRYTNICEYTVCWGRNGIDPLVNRSHSYYIEQVCSDFQKAVLNQLNKIMSSKNVKELSDVRKRKEAFQNYIKQEILEHVHQCQNLAKSFMGRQPVLLDLKDRVWFSNRKVIVVHGETGSGKSTIIAKAALLANGWIPGYQIVKRLDKTDACVLSGQGATHIGVNIVVFLA
nr:PREDICTED: NACHT and WD repeat domain-containing protein 2-like [Latimeria chalumnae]|eukprot:XP_005989550.2 PREDICTED: NACHT and WD repeat domain-containing protein 2-like [Latimeria chalumnae]